MGNLASTHKNLGRWDKAEGLFVQVMEARKRVLGPEHPDTVTTMVNLAFTWRGMSQNMKAMELMMECIRLRKQILGAEHPHTLYVSETLSRWQKGAEDEH
jgi:hypothetical protein